MKKFCALLATAVLILTFSTVVLAGPSGGGGDEDDYTKIVVKP